MTTEIQEWVRRVAETPLSDGSIADVCVIELGGTIGDIESMPFVEAFRQFQFAVGRENFMLVHVSLVGRRTCASGKGRARARAGALLRFLPSH